MRVQLSNILTAQISSIEPLFNVTCCHPTTNTRHNNTYVQCRTEISKTKVTDDLTEDTDTEL